MQSEQCDVQAGRVAPRTALWGVMRRRERWGLSRRGWVLALVICTLIVVVLVTAVHPFLSLTSPVAADVLVVEGWVADHALESAAKEFQARKCNRLYSTGGPISKGSYLAQYKTFADLGAATLCKLGLDSNAVVSVPAPATRMDRTYQSAIALRQWFADAGQRVSGLNVVTIGAHARRTRLLYKRAFGREVAVGVIAVPTSEYDPECWWKYSAGLRTVVGEASGYVYALLLSR